MPTKKKRINLAPPEKLYLLIKQYAELENVPIATKAIELLSQMVELEESEDAFLSAVADKRIGDGSSYIPDSDDIWK